MFLGSFEIRDYNRKIADFKDYFKIESWLSLGATEINVYSIS